MRGISFTWQCSSQGAQCTKPTSATSQARLLSNIATSLSAQCNACPIPPSNLCDDYLLTHLALSFKISRWYLVQLCEDNVEAVQSLRDVSGWQKLPVATAHYCHNTCIAPHTKCHTQCHTQQSTQCHTTWWQCILLLVKISQDDDSQVTTHLLNTALTYNDIFEAGFRQVSSLVKILRTIHTKWLPCSCDNILQFSVYVHLSNLLCLLIYSWCLVVAPAMNGRSNSGEHFWIPRRRFENSFPPVDHIHGEEEPQGNVSTKQMQAHVPGLTDCTYSLTTENWAALLKLPSVIIYKTWYSEWGACYVFFARQRLFLALLMLSSMNSATSASNLRAQNSGTLNLNYCAALLSWALSRKSGWPCR